jgi:DNA-binding CsgD family transcriptional regulator
MTQPWPMIGRGVEVSSILSSLARRVGTVVVGEAGVGKTMLAREVQRELESQGWSTQLVLGTTSSELHVPAFAQAISGGDPDALAPVDRLQRSLGPIGVSAVVVDDAHLLDDGSAELLWQLAGTGGVPVVATVRSHRRTSDHVARLWTDGLCERLELSPLSEAHVRALLESVLGGDVEDRLPRLLLRRAGGNALLLRELIRSGIESGAITQNHEVWRLAGDLPIGAGAADVIRANLAGLKPDELRAAQLLAVGEPLSLHTAELAVGPVMLERLEDAHVLAVADTIDGPALTLSHPLYGEVLRSDVAPLRLRRLRSELIQASESALASNPHEGLRRAVWRVELGEIPDPEELLAAARLARTLDRTTAERLARAAVTAGGSTAAVLLLADGLIMEGRVAEAARLMDDLPADALSPEDVQTVAYARVLCRTRLGEVSAVTAMITGAASHAAEQDRNSSLLQAVNAQALCMDGRMEESVAAARPLFDDRSADPVTRTLAATTLIVGGIFSGRSNYVDSFFPEAAPLAEEARPALPYGLGSMIVGSCISLAAAGRLDESEIIAKGLYERGLAEDDAWLRPRGASGLGVVALMRGQPRTATRYFRITVASLNEFDYLFLRYNLSYLARGAALAGFLAEAQEALIAPDDAPRLPIFEADWGMAEAAVLAAEGRLDAAADRALQAARHAASLGQWGAVALAAHDAARYAPSAEAVLLAATAAERVDGHLAACQSDYARARQSNNPQLLLGASRRFEELGAILYATESAYAAARAYRQIDDGRAAVAASVAAASLHLRCEEAPLPWVAGYQAIEALTPREHQVALLAAAGRPDAEIASELAISVRTVQTHLATTYRKLAINTRRDLGDALAPEQGSRGEQTRQ